MTLRHATPTDTAALVALYDSAAHWLLARGIPQWEPGALTAHSLEPAIAAQNVFVATKPALTENAGLVGAFIFAPRDPVIWPSAAPPALYVTRLVVADSYRGRGVGAWLLQEAVRIAKARDAHVLRLDCWAGNGALCRFYRAQGFTPVGVVPEESWEVQRFEMSVDGL